MQALPRCWPGTPCPPAWGDKPARTAPLRAPPGRWPRGANHPTWAATALPGDAPLEAGQALTVQLAQPAATLDFESKSLTLGQMLRTLDAWLRRGDNVVLDRYVEANFGHQASKLPPAERPALIAQLAEAMGEVDEAIL